MKHSAVIALTITIPFITLGLLGNLLVAHEGSELVSHSPPLKWEASTPLPQGVARPSSQVLELANKEFIYVIGGALGKVPISTVYYAEVQPNIGVGQWQTTAAVSTTGIALHGTAVVSNQVFVIGGVKGSTSSSTPLSTVYCTTPSTNGAIGMWKGTTPLLTPLKNHAVLSIGDRIYVIGGYTTNNLLLSSVYSGQARDNCGPIDWRPEISLPHSLSHPSAVAFLNNDGHAVIYVVGGWYSRTIQNTVYSASIGITGNIQGWYTATHLPITPGLIYHTAIASDRALYILGGTSDPINYTPVISVYRADIGHNNEIGEFVASPNPLPIPLRHHSAAVGSTGQIYAVGGTTIQNGMSIESKNVFFTPLALFEKQAFPAGTVVPGDYITYSLLYTNNGLRQLDDLFVIDKVPLDTWVVHPDYPTDTQVIAWTIPTLPITGSGSVSFTVQVQPRSAETRTLASGAAEHIDKSILNTLKAVVVPARPDNQATASVPVPIETPIPPAKAVSTSGATPTPQPGPAVAGPDCPPTDTPTPTSTPTPKPGAALITNFAWLCEGNFRWCITSNTTLNASHQVYLPIIPKGTIP